MSHMLSEPGFWEIDEADYHADPAPDPSLSQSVGKILLESCPRSAWWGHPRLNPHFTGEESTKYDRGTVAHKLLLGLGKQFRIIDAPDFRTKSAQLERDAYRQAGFTPILRDHYDVADAMVRAARLQLGEGIDGGEHAFNKMFGDFELCALAIDCTGIWTRSLIDFYGARVPSGMVCWDYKTTSGSANPAAIKGRFNQLGWAFQAAFQERIITQLKPELAGKITFRFLVQEDEEPYLCSVVEPDGSARTLAHKMVAAACAIWKRCLVTGHWPGYPPNSVAIGVTPGLEAGWLARELDDDLVQLAANDPYLNMYAWPAAPQPPILPEWAPQIEASAQFGPPQCPHGIKKDGTPAKKRGPKPRHEIAETEAPPPPPDVLKMEE